MRIDDDFDAGAQFMAEAQCAWSGHIWQPAGGGLLICADCYAEKWDDEDDLGY